MMAADDGLSISSKSAHGCSFPSKTVKKEEANVF